MKVVSVNVNVSTIKQKELQQQIQNILRAYLEGRTIPYSDY